MSYQTHRRGTAPPEKDKAPVCDDGGPKDKSTCPSYHHDPAPSTYPRQYLRRSRLGWVLTALDGWGRRVSRTCATRTEALDLLAMMGTLTAAMADTVTGGGHHG